MSGQIDWTLQPLQARNSKIVLEIKHPPNQPGKQSAITIPGMHITQPHPFLFNRIDGDFICSTALKTDGAAGPSGASCSSLEIPVAIAPPSNLHPLIFVMLWLQQPDLDWYTHAMWIQMGSQPWLPVSASPWITVLEWDQSALVRQYIERIIGRSIATAISEDIQAAAGPLQVCAGHLSCCEAAIHVIL